MENKSPESQERILLTVRQFSEKHKAFPEGGLRHQIFNAKDNGFNNCIRRMGRKILIDEAAFFEWLDSQNAQSNAA